MEGRASPGILRAVVLFLVFVGLFLPTFQDNSAIDRPRGVALLDFSTSMALPVEGSGTGGRSRFDSALVVLGALAPDRVYLFGEAPAAMHPDSLAGLRPEHGRSRVREAFEAAHLGGADSVWLLTDGEIADRAAALELAIELGLGVRELRVSEPQSGVGLAAMQLPSRGRSGDTLRATLELVSGGPPAGLPDSVLIEIRTDGGRIAEQWLPSPDPDRVGRASIPFPAPDVESGSDWIRYEARLLDPPSDAGVVAWVEVSASAGAAVMVSLVADWELKFLAPILDRTVLGGAIGFQHLVDGRFLEIGARPTVREASHVVDAVAGAGMLVVHGDVGGIPAWLETAMRTQQRLLVFAEGPGEVPGARVRLAGPLPGDWYPTGSPPPSPAAPLLEGLELNTLQPVRGLYTMDPPGRWTVLQVQRNRRGEERPLLAAGETGAHRWAVVASSDGWRWALRDGTPRRVYEGVFSAVAGWLGEGVDPRPVYLLGTPAPGEVPIWRIALGVGQVTVELLDDEGGTVWRNEGASAPGEVRGPALEAGRYEAVVTAQGPDGPIEIRRPLEVAPEPGEFLPRPVSEPAHIAPADLVRSPSRPATPRPVWPFVLAALILCAEWIWRHRLGLR